MVSRGYSIVSSKSFASALNLPSWLCTGHTDLFVWSIFLQVLHTPLRNLGGLTRTGLADQHDRVVLVEHLLKLLLVLIDGQLLSFFQQFEILSRIQFARVRVDHWIG